MCVVHIHARFDGWNRGIGIFCCGKMLCECRALLKEVMGLRHISCEVTSKNFPWERIRKDVKYQLAAHGTVSDPYGGTHDEFCIGGKMNTLFKSKIVQRHRANPCIASFRFRTDVQTLRQQTIMNLCCADDRENNLFLCVKRNRRILLYAVAAD